MTLEASETIGGREENLLITLVLVTVSTTTEACSWKPVALPGPGIDQTGMNVPGKEQHEESSYANIPLKFK